MRSHDAQLGGLSPQAADQAGDLDEDRRQQRQARTASRPRKARPVGLGRGVCNTSTAGMIDNGDSATTSASGMSSVSTDPQLPDIGGPFVASSSVKVASREALMVAIKGGSLPVHKPSARR